MPKDSTFQKILIVSSFIWLTIILTLSLKTDQLPPEVPLYFLKPEGQRLAPRQALWILGGLATLFFALNNLLSFIFYKKEKLVSQILSITSLWCLAFTLIALWKIINLTS